MLPLDLKSHLKGVCASQGAGWTHRSGLVFTPHTIFEGPVYGLNTSGGAAKYGEIDWRPQLHALLTYDSVFKPHTARRYFAATTSMAKLREMRGEAGPEGEVKESDRAAAPWEAQQV